MVLRRWVGTLLSAGLLLALAASASASELRLRPIAVVELFTSQGCSSSPPADAILRELGKRQDIVTLAYHVDYWDYIGWVDTFGDAANSDLQRDYAASWGNSRIYTPQIIVNGAKGVAGSRRSEVEAALKGASLPLPVMLLTTDGALEVTIPGQAGLPDAIVWLVTYRDWAQVEIERGENEGARIDYTQIVTGRQVLAMWEAGSGAHFKLPLAEVLTGDSNGAAILVQAEENSLPGVILGAAAFTH